MKNTKSQFLGTKKAIIKWLDKYGVSNYTVNDDLSVDVIGGVDISRQNLKFIPIKFGKVTGNFWCHNNNLISLAGSPKTVGGSFDCGKNLLTDLGEAPESVGGYFSCNYNPLTTLINFPKIIKGNFHGIDNKLISLNELNYCDLKGSLFFSFDKKNFKPKELIQVLDKYKNGDEYYVLSDEEFNDKIKPILQKIILQQKLGKPYYRHIITRARKSLI